MAAVVTIATKQMARFSYLVRSLDLMLLANC
jgi:hypothetical protein